MQATGETDALPNMLPDFGDPYTVLHDAPQNQYAPLVSADEGALVVPPQFATSSE